MNSVNRVNFLRQNKIDSLQLNGSVSMNQNEINVKNFKDVMGEMISEMNDITNKPQEMVKEAMFGNADIHDVMAAISQSELTVQAATTITGKILQTYEKIMQIQI